MLIKLLRGSSLVFIGIVSGKLVAMASSVIMARSLSPHCFGIFLLGLSIFQVAATVSNLGVPGVLPSLLAKIDLSREQEEAHRLIRGAICSCLGSALLVSAAVFICSDYVSSKIFSIPEMSGMLKLISAIIPMAVTTSVLTAAFRGYGWVWPRVLFQDLMPGFLTLLFFLAFINFGLKLSGAYIAFGMSSLLVLVLIAWSIRKQLRIGLRLRIRELRTIMEVLCLSWPLGVESLVWVVYTQVDKLLIGCFLPPSEVGIYAAAASLSVILSIIPQAFSYLALPAFSVLVLNGPKNELASLYGIISRIIFQVSFPVFLCLVMLSKEILTVLYGNAYSNGAGVLAILAAGSMAACLLGPTSEILVSAGRTKAPLAASAAGCLVLLA
jgi:stage V sporulation protein B